ncbi:MAG: hypothetical protein KME60_21890 [Cyanomargarita calcarea GSE-NOS-MK-12-04C]|jgi:hypothetical protein|uniref:Uncharacterized protein n=1 Tax=Cyanomargarita calcarea GSE-NOS-MK-12-04C TaxID=2839659 RepID=A0A951UUF5_9CYAN|nr:hypothetical protein [Cyanomargarita calcarea GSE-NOS-MK-12-04C]
MKEEGRRKKEEGGLYSTLQVNEVHPLPKAYGEGWGGVFLYLTKLKFAVCGDWKPNSKRNTCVLVGVLKRAARINSIDIIRAGEACLTGVT